MSIRYVETILILFIIVLSLLSTISIHAKYIAIAKNPKIISVPQDYTKIQDAIDHASPGDVIVVSKKQQYPYYEYDEDIYIVGKSDITITFDNGVHLLGAITINGSQDIVLKNVVVVTYEGYNIPYNIGILYSRNIVLEGVKSAVPTDHPPAAISPQGGRIVLENSNNISLINVEESDSYDVGVKINRSRDVFIYNSHLTDQFKAVNSRNIVIKDTIIESVNVELNGITMLAIINSVIGSEEYSALASRIASSENVTILYSKIMQLKCTAVGDLYMVGSNVSKYLELEITKDKPVIVFNNSINVLKIGISDKDVPTGIAHVWYNDIGYLEVTMKNELGTTSKYKNVFNSNKEIEYTYKGKAFRGYLGNYYSVLDEMISNGRTSGRQGMTRIKILGNITGELDKNGDGVYDNITLHIYYGSHTECGYLINYILVKPRSYYSFSIPEEIKEILNRGKKPQETPTQSPSASGGSTGTTESTSEAGGSYYIVIVVIVVIMIIAGIIAFKKMKR